MSVGAWKNISELEEELSLAELNAIILARRDAEARLFRVILATVGIDTNEGEEGPLTGDDIKRRVQSGVRDANDIVSLQGDAGREAGFMIGPDLGYEIEE